MAADSDRAPEIDSDARALLFAGTVGTKASADADANKSLGALLKSTDAGACVVCARCLGSAQCVVRTGVPEDEEQTTCKVCGEKFEQVYLQASEKWIYDGECGRCGVRIRDVNVACRHSVRQ
jgi:hypothetical protein